MQKPKRQPNNLFRRLVQLPVRLLRWWFAYPKRRVTRATLEGRRTWTAWPGAILRWLFINLALVGLCLIALMTLMIHDMNRRAGDILATQHVTAVAQTATRVAILALTPSATPSNTPTASATPTASDTPTPSNTPTITRTPSATFTPRPTQESVARLIRGILPGAVVLSPTSGNTDMMRIQYYPHYTSAADLRGQLPAIERLFAQAICALRNAGYRGRDFDITALIQVDFGGSRDFVEGLEIQTSPGDLSDGDCANPHSVRLQSVVDWYHLAPELTLPPGPDAGTLIPRPGGSSGTSNASSGGQSTETWYINATSRVNVRACASTDCEVIAGVNPSDAVEVIGTDGDWHEIHLPDGRTGYVAVSLTSRNRPVIATVIPVEVQQPVAPAQPQTQSTSPASLQQEPTQPPAPDWGCGGDIYDCGSFASCAEMWNYFRSCPGDPSNLDGNGDGEPCESRCG